MCVRVLYTFSLSFVSHTHAHARAYISICKIYIELRATLLSNFIATPLIAHVRRRSISRRRKYVAIINPFCIRNATKR